MISSKEYYSNISKDYLAISQERENYLNTVNQLIISNAPTRTQAYLDIGAGDGMRSRLIKSKINANKTILIDNCPEMFEDEGDIKFINSDILEFTTDLKFDVVTCLWNVMGHVGDKRQREQAFHNIAKLLREGGKFFIDVNNRYNINAYSFKNVVTNVCKDVLHIPHRGYFSIGKGEDATQVYIHHPFELERLAKSCGLKLIEKTYINYSSGIIESKFYKGQVFYIFSK